MLRFETRDVEKWLCFFSVFLTRYTLEMNCSSGGSSKMLCNHFQTVHYFLNFKENYFFHNYTGSMQSIKHKSGEEFAYFVFQLQTCERTIYRNSGT